MTVRKRFVQISVITFVLLAITSYYWTNALWSLVIILPLFVMGMFDILQNKHTIRKNFPVIGRFRYMLEAIRPEIMQYFVETDTEGRPISRVYRSLVYQRAKKANDTVAFGTQLDLSLIHI